MRLGSIGTVAFGAAMATMLAMPAGVHASTSPDPSPPSCVLETSTVDAGTQFEAAGRLPQPDSSVTVLATRDKNDVREASIFRSSDTWRGTIPFGAADGGSWLIEISVDGSDCVSPLQVVLPAGVVAPPTQAPDDSIEQPMTGIDAGAIVGMAATVAAVLVVASWLFLIVLAILGFAKGARLREHTRLRALARVAAFLAILGGFLAVGIFIYFGIAMSHFDSGIPPDQKALLDIGMWGLAVTGSVAGVVIARRLGR